MNRSRQVPADETPAFGGIAERFRRAGDLERAVALCRDGLKKFPDHLSARVTLGWSLLDLGRYDEAQGELEQVLKRAPDNLAAIRGLAELHERAENAVTVPIEEHEAAEAAEAAAALEAAHALEAENARHKAPPEPAKKAKAHREPARTPEPPPVSVFAEPARVPEPARMPEPTLEELSAQFAAAEPSPAPEVVQAPEPPPAPSVELPGPVPVLDARGEVIPELAVSAAPEVMAPGPVAAEPVLDDLPNLVEELLTPAQAAMHTPVVEAVVDVPAEPEVALVDFDVEPTAADADALLAEAALLSAAEPEPVAAASIPVADVEIPTTMFEAGPVAEQAELHPHPELTDAAPVAHDPIADQAHASMIAAEHLAAAHHAHPEPDVTELLAHLAQEADGETPAPMVAAEPVMPDVHPQPDISELASQFAPDVAEPALQVEAFESEPAWNAATPDFVAAMETAAAERPVVHEQPAPAGAEAFALSADLAAPASPDDSADFTLKDEPLAVVETAADQRALDLMDVAPAPAKAPQAGVAQALNFEAPPAPPAAAIPPPPAPVAPPPAPAPIFAQVASPPVAAPVARPPAPAPARAKAKPAKAIKTMATLEKMLRGIESRRAQIASEYRPS